MKLESKIYEYDLFFLMNSVVYPSNYHAIMILCDVGGGGSLAWYDSRHTDR